jgi:hypothetical protein
MDVKADGAVWSGGKDAAVVRWDERSRRPATKLKGELVFLWDSGEGSVLMVSFCEKATAGVVGGG